MKPVTIPYTDDDGSTKTVRVPVGADLAALGGGRGLLITWSKGFPPVVTGTRVLSESELEKHLIRQSHAVTLTAPPRLVVEDALARLEDPSLKLIRVPDLVRRLVGRLTVEEVHAALLQAAEEGALELRPEAGSQFLKPEDAALCPPGPRGTVFSYARRVCQLLWYGIADAGGRFWCTGVVRTFDAAGTVRALLEVEDPPKEALDTFELRGVVKGLGEAELMLRATELQNEHGKPFHVALLATEMARSGCARHEIAAAIHKAQKDGLIELKRSELTPAWRGLLDDPELANKFVRLRTRKERAGDAR